MALWWSPVNAAGDNFIVGRVYSIAEQDAQQQIEERIQKINWKEALQKTKSSGLLSVFVPRATENNEYMITPEFSFGDNQKQKQVLKFHHRIFFAYELLLRRVIQKSKYNLYRFAFVFYKWPSIIMFSFRQLVNRYGGSPDLK